MMDEKRSEIPVVILRGGGDEMTASQVIQAGAYDYLPKEMASSKSLSGVISSSLEKFRLKKQQDEAQKKIVEMATRDELTGLYNRRYFMEALEREVSRAKRYETDLALCMIDLDHFKRINDTYGHPAGDKVLLEIGKILKECIRQSDLPCRYGGEEFALILPSTQTEEAYIVCERVRDMVSQHQFRYNLYPLRITTSIGIASFNLSNPEAPLVYRADEALYQAKEGGRNTVVEYQQIQELWN
jgi:two-component system cell cycle response regulator